MHLKEVSSRIKQVIDKKCADILLGGFPYYLLKDAFTSSKVQSSKVESLLANRI